MASQRGKKNIGFWVAYPVFLAVGAACLVYLHRRFPLENVNWLNLAVFQIFLILADTKLSQSAVGGGKVTPSKSIVLSALVLFGPTVAATLEAISALFRGLVMRQSSVQKTLFNCAMLSTSAGVAGMVYHSLPWHDRLQSPLFVIPMLAALLCHSLINSVMLATILSLSVSQPIRSVYRRTMSWAQLVTMSDGPFAAIVVLLYQQAGVWTLGLYLAVVMAIYHNVRLFQRMKEAHINSIAALTTALEADEPYTHGHSYRVSRYALRLGRSLHMSDADLEVLEYGGLLHDIGKIAITNDIICKPGRLTDEEFNTVKTHPTIGADIVEQIRFLRDAADLVRHHHERPDGKGYPHGLPEDEVSIGCHILNVCDAFDAMTSDRPYRAALTSERAMEELVRHRGTQFLPLVVDTALKLYHQGKFNVINETEGLGASFRQVRVS